MGNEMSMESGTQGYNQDFDNRKERDMSHFPENIPDTSPHSNGSYAIKPMEEDEITRQLKVQNANIDIYNTGVSEQLKQLLATLHESDSSPYYVPPSSASKQPSATAATGGRSFGAGFSVAAQEFVPGKPFAAPATTSSSASLAGGDAVGGNSMLKADAPEFVPSWGKPASATPAAVASVLPNPAAVTNIKVIDKKVWYYRDPNGVVRGPFSTTEMRAWADKGYFTGGLEIALSDRGPYLPLSAVYPTPERPFWKSIEPREFATRMRQHAVSSSRTPSLPEN